MIDVMLSSILPSINPLIGDAKEVDSLWFA